MALCFCFNITRIAGHMCFLLSKSTDGFFSAILCSRSYAHGMRVLSSCTRAHTAGSTKGIICALNMQQHRSSIQVCFLLARAFGIYSKISCVVEQSLIMLLDLVILFLRSALFYKLHTSAKYVRAPICLCALQSLRSILRPGAWGRPHR